MNKILIFLLIIIGVIIFTVGGGGLGILYQKQKDASQIEKLQARESVLNSVVKRLSSKLIQSIASYGKVSKIEGRNVTLTFEGESLTIKVREEALIFSFTHTLGRSLTGEAAPLKKGDTVITTRQKVELKDIKLGDDLGINIKLLPDGQLEGQFITIVPPFIQN